jgi:general secretion pathway protein J
MAGRLRAPLMVGPGASGFTLLELLVAIVLCGLLLAGLLQGTRFGILASSISDRMTRGNDDLNIMDSTVRHLIEGMNPGEALGRAPMSGGSDWLKCIAALPKASQSAPVRGMIAELRLDDSHRLVLRWRPYLHSTHLGPAPAPTDTELLRGVERIAISYWVPGGNWTSAWHADELPVLVRVRLQFAEGDSRHWPDIVAAPGLDRP